MGTMPPPERKRAEYLHIPPELVEKVLLNLPVKSLTRFLSVSKSWKWTIHSRDFAKRYRGREMIVLKFYKSNTALVSHLSSILSMANFPLPLTDSSCFVASCGELWCVEFENSVGMYNPSTRVCRKLPASSTQMFPSWWFIYGLGYDSATDDYKVLKFDRNFNGGNEMELYSRRSDSWRMLSGSRENIRVCMSLPSRCEMKFLSEYGVFVNGLLHWILRCAHVDEISHFWVVTDNIFSFDLSTEKIGKVALPESITKSAYVDLSVLRAMLCVYSDDPRQRKGVMWVLDDQGLWIKEVVINYSHIFPEIRSSYLRVKPLYSYNNIKVFGGSTSTNIQRNFLCEDDSTQVKEKNFGCKIIDTFTYVESMVEP